MVNLTNMHMWVITMLCIWDEIKRSDGSVEAQQFGELLKRVRYGKFDQYAYVGNYNAVYLDIKRSDGSYNNLENY